MAGGRCSSARGGCGPSEPEPEPLRSLAINIVISEFEEIRDRHRAPRGCETLLLLESTGLFVGRWGCSRVTEPDVFRKRTRIVCMRIYIGTLSLIYIVDGHEIRESQGARSGSGRASEC